MKYSIPGKQKRRAVAGGINSVLIDPQGKNFPCVQGYKVLNHRHGEIWLCNLNRIDDAQGQEEIFFAAAEAKSDQAAVQYRRQVSEENAPRPDHHRRAFSNLLLFQRHLRLHQDRQTSHDKTSA